MKRIVFGALGIIANGIGLIVMPFVAGLAVAVVALLSATPVSLGGASGTFDASASSLHYVYVPTAEAGSVSCTAEGGADAVWEPEGTTVPTTVDGAEYSPVGSVTVTSDQEVTLSCEGASDVAVADVGMMGTLIGLGVGLVIPIGLGLIAVILLIWGIIARVRS
ncbi:hypothetical protein [Brachybacterium sacelli]|uniref:Ig-like domain-containing protein n=2 Tax=Brachybacterium sacelli TaxID=173364 RepID=A0ABS4X0I7_9MICO|nr:hypothetical protein [Brachybacterium sacelli]MBP2381981.1 hypothetical protein [Brachybacterium sacelli]